jgi:hypothetical protein
VVGREDGRDGKGSITVMASDFKSDHIELDDDSCRIPGSPRGDKAGIVILEEKVEFSADLRCELALVVAV